ncbi:MAG: putative xanthine dehydrogenase subunit A [Syntrophorhabdaceae bacterium PtaU1.Bin034]|jgi:xanthine dehydrogenase accessory factor|nr:MAG: putative xanthine dehydrogenase subunit A [Syntrophorhabdaceae bacterium PtaU1.Bin034]
MDVYEAVDSYLSGGRRGTLATIIKKIGAAPREEGAKMFIGDDGKFFGTVGGGCVEAEVWQTAKNVAKTQKVKLLHYRMDGRIVEDEGMICGGNIDIFLEPVHERYKNLYSEVRLLEKGGKNALIITRYTDDSFHKSLVLEDGSIVGDEIDEKEAGTRFRSYLNERRPILGKGMVIEPIVSSSLLYLFGAGHISQYVAKIAAMIDFNIVVIDDREDFANKERFAEAEEIIVEDFHKVFDRLSFRGNEYVAILTRGHKHDALVLEEVIKRPTRYVGMIGSRRKTKLVLDHLRAKGYDEDALKAVHAPIGIDIQSETPQEIAVSIAAELIEVKRRT